MVDRVHKGNDFKSADKSFNQVLFVSEATCNIQERSVNNSSSYVGTDVVLGFAVRCVVNARHGVEVHYTVKKQLQILSLRNLVGVSIMMP